MLLENRLGRLQNLITLLNEFNLEVCEMFRDCLVVCILALVCLSCAATSNPENRLVKVSPTTRDILQDVAIWSNKNLPSIDFAGNEVFDRWATIFDRSIKMRMKIWSDGKSDLVDWSVYWSEFGSRGPVFDFFLVMSDPMIMLPGDESAASEVWNPAVHASEMYQRLYRAQIQVARSQFQSFVRNHRKLARYSHIVAWSHLYLIGQRRGYVDLMSYANDIGRRLNSSNSDKFWWGARDFMVLVYLTHRVDLLENLESTDGLKNVFKAWLDWIRRNRRNLTPAKDGIGWEIGGGITAAFKKWGCVPYPTYSDSPLSKWPKALAPPPSRALIYVYGP